MRVETIRFRKVVQVKEYEPEEVEFTVNPESTPVEECLAELRNQAEAFFGGTAEPIKKPTKVEEKKPTKKPTKKVTEKPVVEEAPLEEKLDKAFEKLAEEKKPTKKTTKKTTTKKPSSLAYNKDNTNHKSDFALALRKADPKWHTIDKPKGQAISKEMYGVEMYDIDGNVLDSFTKTVVEKWNS